MSMEEPGMSLARTPNQENVGVEYSMQRTHRSDLVAAAYV